MTKNKAYKKKNILAHLDTKDSVNYPDNIDDDSDEEEIFQNEPVKKKYEGKENITKELDNKYLLLNTEEGADLRREIQHQILGSTPTDYDANEASWILEYYFGTHIVPSFYNSPKIEPTMKKFMSDTTNNNSYFDPWDFLFSDVAVEIKTVYMDYTQTYKKPIFQCPYAKITDDLPVGKDFYDIWWYVTSNPLEVIDKRDKKPSPWYYFRFTDEILANLTSEINDYGTKWFYQRTMSEDGYPVRQKLFYLKKNTGGQPTMTFNEYALKRYDY